jgi:hypothetical protein
MLCESNGEERMRILLATIALAAMSISSAAHAETGSCSSGVQILCSQPGTGDWSVSVTDENDLPPTFCMGQNEHRCVAAIGAASVQNCAGFSATEPSVPGFSTVGAPQDGTVGQAQCSYVQVSCLVTAKSVDPQGHEAVGETRSCAGMKARWNN